MAEADSKKQLKSILKTPSQSFAPPQSPVQPAVPGLGQDEIREILRLEQQVFDDSMLLVTFPRAQPPEFTAAHPDSRDVAEFKRRIAMFKTEDYEGLVQERNAEKKCGYVLCANRNRTYERGQKGLVDISRSSFNVMPGEELSKWCSNGCMRRALYVQVQLREMLRSGIDLMDEGESQSSKTTASASKKAAAVQARKDEDMATLAQERGTPRRTLPSNSLTLAIREKKVNIAPTAPVLQSEDDHKNIEGHAPGRRFIEEDPSERDERPPTVSDAEALKLFKSEPDDSGSESDEDSDADATTNSVGFM